VVDATSFSAILWQWTCISNNSEVQGGVEVKSEKYYYSKSGLIRASYDRRMKKWQVDKFMTYRERCKLSNPPRYIAVSLDDSFWFPLLLSDRSTVFFMLVNGL
jgi:hypothetical protein